MTERQAGSIAGSLEAIDLSLRRLASAAESPFWRLFQMKYTDLYQNGDGTWTAATVMLESKLSIEGHGPTPQAAVEKFDEAFRRGPV